MHAYPELLPIREASRRLVRGLGILNPLPLLGVPFGQCHALIEIERAGAISVNGLAEALLLDRSVASRIVSALQKDGLVSVSADSQDARKKLVSLTQEGLKRMVEIHEASSRPVVAALKLLTAEERESVLRGLDLYGNALIKASLAKGLVIREIRKEDDAQVAQLIKTVMTEIGAVGPGYSINDPEVLAMSEYYPGPKAAVLVLVRDKQVLGCGGFFRLLDGPEDTCELRKMYFYPEVRGLGKAQEMISEIMDRARIAGYKRMYLETVTQASKARALYERNGFVEIPGACGNTGHGGCEKFYEREL